MRGALVDLLRARLASRPVESATRTPPQHFEAANLYSQEAGLRDDPRVAVFTNKDDFILQPSDLAWLERVFTGRITVFRSGGHLGNLYLHGR